MPSSKTTSNALETTGATSINRDKTILVVATRRFWPPDSGRKVVLYNYCKCLAEDLGYRVCVYCFLEAGQADNEDVMPAFISDVRYARPVSRFAKVSGILRSVLVRTRPYQSFAYCNKGNIEALRSYQGEVGAKVIFVDMIRLAPLVEASLPGGRVILDLDDLLSKRYGRQLSYTKDGANVLGRLGESEKGLARLASLPSVRKMILRTESCQVARAEAFYAQRSSAVVLISPKEAREFALENPQANVIAAPMGVDYEFYSSGSIPERKDNYAVFVGDMHTAANRDSLIDICENVLPHIPDVELGVIGSCPQELCDRLRSHSQVRFLGRVDDLRTSVKEARVFLAPLSYGTGVKTKLLEAMAMGVPIVTNAIGVEGLDVHDGVECFIKESPCEQAGAVKALFSCADYAAKMACAAQEYVSERHRWEECTKAFRSIGL